MGRSEYPGRFSMETTNEFSEQTTIHETDSRIGTTMWLVMLGIVAAASFGAGWKAHAEAAPTGVRVEMVAGVPCAVTAAAIDCDWQMATKKKED